MRILVVHNTYQQPGGEDIAAEREASLLSNAGHEIIWYRRSNNEVNQLSFWGKMTLPKRMIWATDAVRDLRQLIARHKPDVAHFHNTHFMISPGAYTACREMRVPVVQSLDNPRLMCPAASFYRDGLLCEDCAGKTLPWPGILHACYRGSRAQTAAVAAMLTVHRLRHTWDTNVDVYVVATEFYRCKFIESGLSAEKTVVKPHFVEPDPLPRQETLGDYALFVGRLDPEKGVRTLLTAWEHLDAIPLRIRGSGRLRREAQAAARRLGTVALVGHLSQDELIQLFKGARFLVWPSEGYYETFGLVAVEAFACGVPVIASRIGVMAEIVQEGHTGLHFTPGDPQDLADKVSWAWTHPEIMAEMGRNARREYEAKYTAARNYELLMSIYDTAIQRSRAVERDTPQASDL
jgi:glycosyltransferase involved in cell wall biosynthesis